jgi:hypothetical protein
MRAWNSTLFPYRIRARQRKDASDQGSDLGGDASVFAAADEFAKAAEDVAGTLCLLHELRQTFVSWPRCHRIS